MTFAKKFIDDSLTNNLLRIASDDDFLKSLGLDIDEEEEEESENNEEKTNKPVFKPNNQPPKQIPPSMPSMPPPNMPSQNIPKMPGQLPSQPNLPQMPKIPMQQQQQQQQQQLQQQQSDQKVTSPQQSSTSALPPQPKLPSQSNLPSQSKLPPQPKLPVEKQQTEQVQTEQRPKRKLTVPQHIIMQNNILQQQQPSNSGQHQFNINQPTPTSKNLSQTSPVQSPASSTSPAPASNSLPSMPKGLPSMPSMPNDLPSMPKQMPQFNSNINQQNDSASTNTNPSTNNINKKDSTKSEGVMIQKLLDEDEAMANGFNDDLNTDTDTDTDEDTNAEDKDKANKEEEKEKEEEPTPEIISDHITSEVNSPFDILSESEIDRSLKLLDDFNDSLYQEEELSNEDIVNMTTNQSANNVATTNLTDSQSTTEQFSNTGTEQNQSEKNYRRAFNYITNTTFTDDFNKLNSPEEVKQYIIDVNVKNNNIGKNSLQELLNASQITSFRTLYNTLCYVYFAAFESDTNIGIVRNNLKSLLTTQISSLIESYRNNIFKEFLNIDNMKQNKYITSKKEDPYYEATSRYIFNHAFGDEKDLFINASSLKTKGQQSFLLYPLMKSCAIRYYISQKYDQLVVDDNKTLDDLRTQPLLSLGAKPNVANMRSVFLDITNIRVQDEAIELAKSMDSMYKRFQKFCENYGDRVKKLTFRDENKKYQYVTGTWDGLISCDAAQIHIQNNANLRDLNQYLGATLDVYTDSSLRMNVIYPKLKMVHAYLKQDLAKLREMIKIVKTIPLTEEIYKDLNAAKRFQTMKLFGLSRSSIFTKAPQYISVRSKENLQILQQQVMKNTSMDNNNEGTTARLMSKNRILLRLAANYQPYGFDRSRKATLTKFLQQPYGKRLLSLLCSTQALGAEGRMSWIDERRSKINNKVLREFVAKYFHEHKQELEQIQTTLINFINQQLFKNNDKLINVLPKINLLNSFNLIDSTFKTKAPSASFKKDANDLGLSSGADYDLVRYIFYTASEGGYTNSAMRNYWRRYVMQPNAVNVLQFYIPELIEQIGRQIENTSRFEMERE